MSRVRSLFLLEKESDGLKATAVRICRPRWSGGAQSTNVDRFASVRVFRLGVRQCAPSIRPAGAVYTERPTEKESESSLLPPTLNI